MKMKMVRWVPDHMVTSAVKWAVSLIILVKWEVNLQEDRV